MVDSWNYTMLSVDGRVLKIAESREDSSTLEASLLKRYAAKRNGGPFKFVARKTRRGRQSKQLMRT